MISWPHKPKVQLRSAISHRDNHPGSKVSHRTQAVRTTSTTQVSVHKIHIQDKSLNHHKTNYCQIRLTMTISGISPQEEKAGIQINNMEIISNMEIETTDSEVKALKKSR